LPLTRPAASVAALRLDPLYVDVIVRRYEAATGNDAVLVETEETFEAARREGEAPPG
jgi:hypothetical protein